MYTGENCAENSLMIRGVLRRFCFRVSGTTTKEVAPVSASMRHAGDPAHFLLHRKDPSWNSGNES